MTATQLLLLLNQIQSQLNDEAQTFIYLVQSALSISTSNDQVINLLACDTFLALAKKLSQQASSLNKLSLKLTSSKSSTPASNPYTNIANQAEQAVHLKKVVQNIVKFYKERELLLSQRALQLIKSKDANCVGAVFGQQAAFYFSQAKDLEDYFKIVSETFQMQQQQESNRAVSFRNQKDDLIAGFVKYYTGVHRTLSIFWKRQANDLLKSRDEVTSTIVSVHGHLLAQHADEMLDNWNAVRSRSSISAETTSQIASLNCSYYIPRVLEAMVLKRFRRHDDHDNNDPTTVSPTPIVDDDEDEDEKQPESSTVTTGTNPLSVPTPIIQNMNNRREGATSLSPPKASASAVVVRNKSPMTVASFTAFMAGLYNAESKKVGQLKQSFNHIESIKDGLECQSSILYSQSQTLISFTGDLNSFISLLFGLYEVRQKKYKDKADSFLKSGNDPTTQKMGVCMNLDATLIREQADFLNQARHKPTNLSTFIAKVEQLYNERQNSFHQIQKYMRRKNEKEIYSVARVQKMIQKQLTTALSQV